jgi:predicted RNA-binding Zn-ribbon protein involved in translation (DUF1610 family)
MATCPRCQDPGPEDETVLCGDCAPLSPGGTLRRTLETWRDHLPTLLLFWTIPAIASTVTQAAVLVRHRDAFEAYTEGLRDVLGGGDPTVLFEPARTLAPWLALDTLVTLVFFGAIWAVADGLARGDDPGPLPGLEASVRRLPPILATGLVFTAAVGFGSLLLVVPGLVALHWFLLSLPAAGRDAGPAHALQRSRDLVREHGSALFPTLVVAVWFGLDSVTVGAGDAVASVAPFGPQDLPAVVASGITEWFVGPILPLFIATYYVHLSAAEERTGAGGTGPGAEAEPGDEVVVGQCPDCGAFVPDDRTRPDLDPVCPTCGYEGPLD